MKKKIKIIIFFACFMALTVTATASFVQLDVLNFSGKTTAYKLSVFVQYDVLNFSGEANISEFGAWFNSCPNATGEHPTNGITNIKRQPAVGCTVEDGNLNHTLNVTYASNYTGGWINYQTNSSIAINGKTNWTFSGASSYATKYWWRVYVHDGFCNNSFVYSFTTENAPQPLTLLDTLSFGGSIELHGDQPLITDEQPSNTEINVEMYPLVQITVTEYQGQKFNITWSTNATGSWKHYNVTCINGTYSQRATWANASDTIYWWSVAVNDTDNYWTNDTYSFTTAPHTWSNWSDMWTFAFLPENYVAPANLSASNYDTQGINLTWNRSENATHTLIRHSKTGYPNSVTDGDKTCNVTGESYNHSGLAPGTQYFYSGWSYNSSIGLFTSRNTATNCTNPGNVADVQVTGITMGSISLSWAKGTNATYTLVIQNETGYANYPCNNTNGTEVYNSTGTSCKITGLTENTTYYFSLWSYNVCGGLSPGNISINETTVASATTPTNFSAVTYGSSQINLSWTKGADINVLIRKIGSYPSSVIDGSEVYNSTGSDYKDIGLTYVTHYYYRIWGWNGEEYSSGYSSTENITLPDPPVDLVGGITGTDLTISWTKGDGAVRTVIRNNLTKYPNSPTGADGSALVYNGTGTTKTVAGVTEIDYYTGWSYVLKDGRHLYSQPQSLLWGGLEINVYKQSNPAIAITDYTVFITNQNGSETYENITCNNPTRIDVSDVPNGVGIAIKISKDGYNHGLKYGDLYENAWYSINFYLSPDTGGGGDEGDEDYIPPEDEPDGENESYGALYLLRVEDIYSMPIENALVDIRLYINQTGVETYESVYTAFTDANGYVDVYLIPGFFYKVTISKEGYQTENPDFIPSDSVFTRTFRLEYQDVEDADDTDIFYGITWSIEPSNHYQHGNFTFYFNITSSNDALEWFKAIVHYYNTSSKEWEELYSETVSTSPSGGSISYTVEDVNISTITGKYKIEGWYKKTGFDPCEGTQAGSTIIYLDYGGLTTSPVFSYIPDWVYLLAIVILMAIVMAFFLPYAGLGTGYIGIAIFALGLILKPGLTTSSGIGGWTILVITVVVYTIALFVWSRI